MSTTYRIKPSGRFIYACKGGCGVFIKIKHMLCHGCVGDLLSGGIAGAWRTQKPNAPKVRHVIDRPGDYINFC